LGTIIGATAALRVKMTAMPEMVAIFNGFGGIASLLVGSSEYLVSGSGFDSLIPIYLTVVIGGITFTGSLIAFSKLSGVITGNPVLYKGQQWVNAILVLILFYLGIEMVASQDWLLVEDWQVISSIVVLAFLLGVLLVIPIGGADMPVVIALLNSYSGLAACAAGFVIENNVLIVAGALVGASGLILTNIMCKAMNRSLANVLFSGFGSVSEGVSETGEQGEARPIISEDAYLILEAATSVAIVPGYGMAVAQAQHAVRELGELMEANGADVQYVIHPVAGRMPGHMNVLLAEANVPYDKLMEPEDINPIIETIDVCIVIGANDVVNPAAREDPNSPIFGMPIIDVDHAVTTFVLKRSMASGFAGIENPLFFKTNTRMLFGDAKDSITALVSEFKS
jgi:NAD(P) transhydrogenase subunit beta